LSWDYRGLYGSTLPRRGAALDISTHAEDLAVILDHAGVQSGAFFGWSMGVQVGIEFYSRYPERISHLILSNGTYGRPLHGVPLPFSGITLPPLVRSVRQFPRMGRWFINHAGRSRLSYSVLRRLYLIAPGFDRNRFERMVQEFERVDLACYLELLEKLHEHDALHLLPSIRVPTLIVAGARDLLTPPWFARKMAETIPGAALFVVPGGTHYSAAEYPDVIAARVEQFLETSEPCTTSSTTAQFANPFPGS
jgi:pimeloyl-ACP methyl ester carboxylesterase